MDIDEALTTIVAGPTDPKDLEEFPFTYEKFWQDAKTKEGACQKMTDLCKISVDKILKGSDPEVVKDWIEENKDRLNWSIPQLIQLTVRAYQKCEEYSQSKCKL